ncbi:hypothetical protein [Thalassospira sp.]|uniref:hypothetical protein n=1 Tax=Thalassospira sp. TaxID=1912094 RepID=UPI0027353FB7|nr:hypothetical protein [Thalassospira sp.]MDP2698428.1 hypothetical protein [Thalassospira sp.]
MVEEEIGEKNLTDSEKKIYVEIWKISVETQMHFNEMSVKSRQLGLTFVAAALGVAVVLFTRDQDFVLDLFSIKIHASVILILASALAVRAVRELDLNVYHKMLRGAVTFGEDFEENYLKSIFKLEKGMTQSISHFSRFSDANIDKSQNIYKYTGKTKITALDKIESFYKKINKYLVITSILIFLINNQFFFNHIKRLCLVIISFK